MADGRWVMTVDELNKVAGGADRRDRSVLPHYKEHQKVDDRSGDAPRVCAFCGSEHIEAGLYGSGNGLGYHSVLCEDCGGTTDFVFRDENHVYFE